MLYGLRFLEVYLLCIVIDGTLNAAVRNRETRAELVPYRARGRTRVTSHVRGGIADGGLHSSTLNVDVRKKVCGRSSSIL